MIQKPKINVREKIGEKYKLEKRKSVKFYEEIIKQIIFFISFSKNKCDIKSERKIIRGMLYDVENCLMFYKFYSDVSFSSLCTL